ncbi:hypothetical protein AV530_012676 [Patagioenas fasciata monilis]|uniref:Uncharacterized protein n=1 Tax=Patagioenas fasciata monilis TaxID=372326 RepID=A0A1V4JBW5_PATFA|nr:hypothetical protein AV530_012676 [Patagioenas fasciata monilis]
MPSGWPPVPLPNTDENNKSRGLESDNLPKEPVKAENAKVVNQCTISPFTNLYLPLPPFNPSTSTREQKEPLNKNWTKELRERLDKLIVSESNSRQCGHADCDKKGDEPGDSALDTENWDFPTLLALSSRRSRPAKNKGLRGRQDSPRKTVRYWTNASISKTSFYTPQH